MKKPAYMQEYKVDINAIIAYFVCFKKMSNEHVLFRTPF